jgi:hypothetical protein
MTSGYDVLQAKSHVGSDLVGRGLKAFVAVHSLKASEGMELLHNLLAIS